MYALLPRASTQRRHHHHQPARREVLASAWTQPGSIRVRLDIGVGCPCASAAAASTSVDIYQRLRRGARGIVLVPLCVRVSQRLPFFHSTLDIVRSMRRRTFVLSGWITAAALQFALSEVPGAAEAGRAVLAGPLLRGGGVVSPWGWRC